MLKNVLISRIKLVTKHATLSVSIDPMATLKMNMGISWKKIELNLDHIANKSLFLIVVLGGFNAKMQGWYQNDITTFEGCKIDIATYQFDLSQIIKEPTHILSNLASCIELIFTSQLKLVMDSGVHPSLHPNCKIQIQNS